MRLFILFSLYLFAIHSTLIHSPPLGQLFTVVFWTVPRIASYSFLPSCFCLDVGTVCSFLLFCPVDFSPSVFPPFSIFSIPRKQLFPKTTFLFSILYQLSVLLGAVLFVPFCYFLFLLFFGIDSSLSSALYLTASHIRRHPSPGVPWTTPPPLTTAIAIFFPDFYPANDPFALSSPFLLLFFPIV